MTDFMTAHQLILLPLTCPGEQRTKGSQFQLTCNLCRESHKTQVWLCFLVLSLLSLSTCAHAFVPGTDHLQTCLKDLRKSIENSDAMLYAPSFDDVKDNCKSMSLKCYMLELMMVMDEEEITELTALDCIFHFNESLQPEVGCPPCESYSLQNITVFLKRLNKLLQSMSSIKRH
ncbi:interleukin-15-like [Acanthochromis polyacanthus]|uniref:Interleukin n=1 Tax=Acanthochromis polyacanthus TaxID=80966 RepID=A0A3Q1GBP0_9TELE|nr:interleukin-15-like [Acanthochromis polyacanthus]